MKNENDYILKIKLNFSIRFNLSKLNILEITLLLDVVFTIISYMLNFR
ncbi:hypothetical protein EJM73_02570 [Clostridium botulinum]|nr:hypothetical protein [Clostridium botulinum]MCC5416754.1 hypothetical protein [Clostridium botulinum]NCI18862.1 hypothetical protein [Clostridium botulinum]NCI34561.1 hypothetical protein [Clostridium botulinum]NCI71401.1 hypothetical protein [Clostridium botulinum]NDI37490.1 hypothetical protein [Clostridium botulinum]